MLRYMYIMIIHILVKVITQMVQLYEITAFHWSCALLDYMSIMGTIGLLYMTYIQTLL